MQWARHDHLPHEGLEIVTTETAAKAAFSMGRDAANKPMEGSRRTLSEHGFSERASFSLEIFS